MLSVACNTGRFTDFSSDKVTWVHGAYDPRGVAGSFSRFQDGYIVNVCVSLSFLIEQQSHRMSCFHWSRSVFVSRRSSVVVDIPLPTLLQTSLALGSTA